MIIACLPSVMAADNAVLLLISYEMLSPQAPDCISKNLNLPEEISGVSVSWESSDEAVVSNTGIVTRPESEPEEVTLTASAGDETKKFVFTVMPETYYVHYSESFDYS